MTITRRQALAGAALLPSLLGAGAAGAQTPLRADAPTHWRFDLIGASLTVLLTSIGSGGNPRRTFGLNVDDEAFAEAARGAFQPLDHLPYVFQPVVIDTGSARVLIDTGMDSFSLRAALEAAGYVAEDITHVLISHMHGDHIGGLTDGGEPTFPGAAHFAGRVEWEHWAGRSDRTFDRKVRPLEARFELLEDGDVPVPGVTALAAFGHTPGHLAFHIAAGTREFLHIVDAAIHPAWSLAHPDWQVSFDSDHAQAAATRRARGSSP